MYTGQQGSVLQQGADLINSTSELLGSDDDAWRCQPAPMLAGNPTNIIVGQAINLTFLNFSKWTLLPTLGAAHQTLPCAPTCIVAPIPLKLVNKL